jgi:hypothetical protein
LIATKCRRHSGLEGETRWKRDKSQHPYRKKKSTKGENTFMARKVKLVASNKVEMGNGHGVDISVSSTNEYVGRGCCQGLKTKKELSKYQTI